MSRTAQQILRECCSTKRRINLQLRLLEDLNTFAAQADLAGPEHAASVSAGIRPLQDLFSQTAGQLCTELRMAECIIRQTEDPLWREVLERHYLHDETFAEIAAAMHFSDRHIRRLHQQALQQLSDAALPESDIAHNSF